MPIQFNQELLDKCLQKTEAVLSETCEKLTQTARIKFQCKCGKNNEKQFRRLLLSGAFCETCMKSENLKKQSEKPYTSSESYNLEVLNTYIGEAEASLVSELPPLKKEARICFLCKCGKEDSKTFVRIKQTGIYCKECTEANRREKRELTNIDRYGTTCTLQNEEIKKKSEDTCLIRYGSSNALKSNEVKQRIRKTNLEKYGSENPFGSPIIIEKIRKTFLEKYEVTVPLRNKTILQKLKETNRRKYGVDVSSKAECVKEKARETNLRIYGMVHHSTPLIKAKIIKTNKLKYGVSHSFQAQVVKEKIKATLLKKHGVDHSSKIPGIQTRIKEINFAKYGVSHPLKCKHIQEKQFATNILRYGTQYPNQSPAIQAKAQKSGLQYKIYTTPTGELRKVQGYEPRALNILFKEHNLPESDVITDRSKMPVISYTSDNKSRRYFPDIYIPSQNKIIEVKSSWTFELYYDINCLKWKATIDAGFQCEFWVFTRDDCSLITKL
jgi:hypothetical protein